MYESEDYFGTGADFTFVVTDCPEGESCENNVAVSIINDVNENDVPLLWIFPQFFLITIAEVMISITGLEFAYTQAPIFMKSVLASFWLLTVSVGNIVVIIVAEGKLMPTQKGEYYAKRFMKI